MGVAESDSARGAGRARGEAQIRDLISRDKLAEARKRLDQMYVDNPSDPTALGLAGLLESRSENHSRALQLSEESLVAELAPAAYRRNLDMFLEVAGAAFDYEAAERAVDRGIPLHDAGQDLALGDVEILVSLAGRLVDLRRGREGLALVEAFDVYFNASATTLTLRGVLKAHSKRYSEALTDLAAGSKMEPLSPAGLVACRVAAAALDDHALARLASREFLDRFPVYLNRRLPKEKLLIGVGNILSKRHIKHSYIMNTEGLYFPQNFTSQLLQSPISEFRTLSILLNSPNSLKILKYLPKPDVIFLGNHSAEAIIHYNALNIMKKLEGKWKRPTINRIDDVMSVTKFSMPTLCEDIDDLLIPKVRRYTGDIGVERLIAKVKDEFEYPVMIQQLDRFFLMRARHDIEFIFRMLNKTKQFYVIQTIDKGWERGVFRKIRAIIVGDAIQLIGVDFDAVLSVHGWESEGRRVLRGGDGDLVEWEAEVCADPERHLGTAVISTLRELRRRIPLDVFGVEFDVMPDGRLLLFEASPAMNLSSTTHVRADRLQGVDAAIALAFRKLVREKQEHWRSGVAGQQHQAMRAG